jgi:hypothetical protein
MYRIFVNLQIVIVAALSSTGASTAKVPQDVGASIEQITGGQCAYIPDGNVYKVILPRTEATIVNDWQTLSPNLGLNSWVGFKPGIDDQAILTGELLLLDDEVDAVISAALEAKLYVTGLASWSVFDGPRLQMLDVTGAGTIPELAASFRKCLDEIQRVRRASVRPKALAPDVPLENSIDPAPLDAVLGLRGVVIGGAYRVTIGAKARLLGEQLGQDMGMCTWVSIGGTNDRAVVHGEFIASIDELQRVLRALREKGISITSIRNHTLGEQPQFVFVQFRGAGASRDLASAVRYALNVQPGSESNVSMGHGSNHLSRNGK